jgi:hypothetical protein
MTNEIVLPTATIVEGSETPTSEGVSKPVRCTLALANGTRRAAVLKRGPVEHIAAEAFCAVLMRAWNLPVPEPFLVVEHDSIAFASADAGYPSLCQRLGVTDLPAGPARDAAARVAAGIAIGLRTAPLAAAIDEAIDNRDRNLGNILWDGISEAWIDHALALGNGNDLQDNNLLCHMAVFLDHYQEMQKGAVGQALALDREKPQEISEHMPSAHSHATEKNVIFVAQRLSSLASKLITRFPQQRDLLSQL